MSPDDKRRLAKVYQRMDAAQNAYHQHGRADPVLMNKYLIFLRRLLDEATAGLDTARAERDNLQKALDPTLKHLRLDNGQVDIAVTGPLLQNFALAIGEHCRAIGAANYLEIGLFSCDEHYTVTYQKVGAMSPGQKAAEAEAERDAAIEALREIADLEGHDPEYTDYDFARDVLALVNQVLAAHSAATKPTDRVEKEASDV